MRACFALLLLPFQAWGFVLLRGKAALPQPSAHRYSRGARVVPKAAMDPHFITEVVVPLASAVPDKLSSTFIAANLDLPTLPGPDQLTEMLKGAPSLNDAKSAVDGFLNSIPSIPSPEEAIPDSVKQAVSSFGQATSDASGAVQGIFDKVKGTLSGIDPSKITNDVQGSANALQQQLQQQLQGVQGQVQGQLSGVQGQVGQAFGSKLSELQGALGQATQKALQPVQPLLNDVGGELSSKLSVVKEITSQITDQVKTEQEVITKNVSPLLKVAMRYWTPRTVFNVENLVALPFWGALILAPNNKLVKNVMSGYLPIFLCAVAYTWLTYLAFQDPVALQGFSSTTDLTALTKGFSSETSVAVAWAHFICQDLFVGRWIYLDGQRNGIWTSHSLALAFLFGPTGIISHLFTRSLAKVVRWDVEDIFVAGSSTLPPSTAEQQAKKLTRDAEKALKDAEATSAKIRNRARKDAEDELGKGRRQVDKLLTSAEKEREIILSKARSEAEALLREARAEAESIITNSQVIRAAAAREAEKAAKAKPAVAVAAAGRGAVNAMDALSMDQPVQEPEPSAASSAPSSSSSSGSGGSAGRSRGFASEPRPRVGGAKPRGGATDAKSGMMMASEDPSEKAA